MFILLDWWNKRLVFLGLPTLWQYWAQEEAVSLMYAQYGCASLLHSFWIVIAYLLVLWSSLIYWWSTEVVRGGWRRAKCICTEKMQFKIISGRLVLAVAFSLQWGFWEKVWRFILCLHIKKKEVKKKMTGDQLAYSHTTLYTMISPYWLSELWWL